LVEKEKIIKRAKELGAENELKYVGCVQSTFCAVVDALREAGIELVTPEVEEIFFTAGVGLSGGVGITCRGSCGALVGASLAVSLATGVGRKEQEKDPMSRQISYKNVREYIANKFLEKYGGLTCREVQWARFGKAWDLTRPECFEDFHKNELEKCRTPDGKTIEECTIPVAAAWAVEAILEILEKKKKG